MLALLGLLACGDDPPRPSDGVEWAGVGTIERLGSAPTIWADLGYKGVYQEVTLHLEERLTPTGPTGTITVFARVLPDLPYTCAQPCSPGVAPSLVGKRVLVRARYRAAVDRFDVLADSRGIIPDPAPEEIEAARNPL